MQSGKWRWHLNVNYRLAKAGCAGILVHGSGGEAVHLTAEERIQVIKAVREACDVADRSDLVIIAGTGAASLQETIKLSLEVLYLRFLN